MGSEISCIYIARVEDGNPLEQFCTSNVRNEHFLTGPSGHFLGWLFGYTPPTRPLHDQTRFNCRNLSRLFGQLF